MGITTKDLLAAERQAMSNEPHPQDDDYSPPVSSVKLPSRGLIYPPDSPLYMAETVDVKAMTAKEEDILSTPALIKRGAVVSTLIKACITNRLIDPDKMLTGDRNAVLIAIRVAAYGPEYKVDVECPECENVALFTFDLSRLPMKTLDEQPIDGPGSNVFAHKLQSGKIVKFKLFCAADIDRLDKEIENARKARAKSEIVGPDQGITSRLLAQVLEIEGVPREKLAKTLINLPARDSRLLRRRMDDAAPGIDMTQNFKCPACEAEKEVEVPLGPEFFWPSQE